MTTGSAIACLFMFERVAAKKSCGPRRLELQGGRRNARSPEAADLPFEARTLFQNAIFYRE